MKLGLIETQINICVQMMNLLACSKDSLFDSASIRKTNLHKGLSLLHFNSAQKTEAVGNAQVCFMQQKPIYKL